MRRFVRPLVALAALPGFFIMTGCMQHELGHASAYRPDHDEKIPVVMPQGAPSISQEFYRHPAGSAHRGIDIVASIGTPVIAAAPGVVTASYFEPAYGNRVTIDHGRNSDGFKSITVYMHLNSRTVSSGDRVARGQKIATLGNTGFLAGGIPHLHFEVHREVKPNVTRAVDPHRVWMNGVGQVSCFDPTAAEPDSYRSTYPVPCR